MTTPPRPIQPALEIPADLQAMYANMVRISHSPVEIVFDFAAMLPGATGAKVINRMIMSPIGAKLFLRALADNVARYEAAFGEIRMPHDSTLAVDLFRGIHPPEGPPPPKPEDPPPPEKGE